MSGYDYRYPDSYSFLHTSSRMTHYTDIEPPSNHFKFPRYVFVGVTEDKYVCNKPCTRFAGHLHGPCNCENRRGWIYFGGLYCKKIKDEKEQELERKRIELTRLEHNYRIVQDYERDHIEVYRDGLKLKGFESWEIPDYVERYAKTIVDKTFYTKYGKMTMDQLWEKELEESMYKTEFEAKMKKE